MTTELSALARLLVYPRHQTLNELNKIDHILQNSRRLDPHTKENLKTFTVALSAAPMSALQNIYHTLIIFIPDSRKQQISSAPAAIGFH